MPGRAFYDGLARCGRIGAPARIALAGALLGSACGDDAGHLYVTSGQTDEVVRLDAATGAVVNRIAVDRRRFETDEPHGIAISPDGRHWYATLAHGAPSLVKFEVDGDRLVGRLTLGGGGAARIGLGPDGAVAYIPDYDRVGGRVGEVVAVRLHDLEPIARAAVCGAPHDAAVDPLGEILAVACSTSDELLFLDPHDLSVLRRIDAPGVKPLNLAWSPDGSRLAVALHMSSSLWVVSRDGETIGTVATGGMPAQLARVDDLRVASANRMDGSVSIVDVFALEELRRYQLGLPFPHGIAIAPRGDVAYVAYEGSHEAPGGVLALELDSGEILWREDVGRYVIGIAHLER